MEELQFGNSRGIPVEVHPNESSVEICMKKTNRRNFLKSTGLSAGALALPIFSIPRSAFAAPHKLNVAVVGAGGMGKYAVNVAATENLVAFCDVDDVRAMQAFKKHPKARRFKDFRVMLDKMWKEIDAVTISTPDHTHFPIAMAAMERGKHVFVQKPLAHNIWQLRTLRKAAKHYGVVTQMGNQGHTFPGMRRIKEWVGADVIGDVTEVVSWTNRPNAPWFVAPEKFPPATSAPPKTLDWDLWQGPVSEREYSPEYVPTKWRGWWDYGCGALGDIGCHTFDAPFAVLGLGSPTKVEVVRHVPPGEGFIPMGAVVTYHFPARGKKPPVVLKWYEASFDVPKPRRWDPSEALPTGGGMYMEGTKETLYHAGMRPTKPMLTPNSRFEAKQSELEQIERLPEVGDGPIEEWIRAIKGDGPTPNSNFDYAVPLTEMVLLGAIAQRTGRTSEWDAENMKIVGQPELDTLINEPVRKGWEYGLSI